MTGSVMERQDYKQLRARAEEQFRSSVHQARAERDAQLAAIDRVWVLAQDAPGDRQRRNASTHAKPTTLIGQIRTAVAAMSRDFTVSEVAEYIRALYGESPRKVRNTSISSALGRLVDGKEIVVHKAGMGRRPTIYSRSDSQKGDDVHD